MPHDDILIVGAGVAGSALAYWLAHHGMRPTVVERAETVRTGGQAIDVHGRAVEVIDRMGLLTAARLAATGVRGVSFVDGRGKTLAATTAFSLTGGDQRGPDVELMRADLMTLLIDASAGKCDYLFGESVTDIDDSDVGVSVTLTSGTRRHFDLVVGADGVNSATRRTVFEPQTYRVDHLGRYVAIATIPNFLDEDRWEIFHAAGPDRRICYYAARNATRVMFAKNDPSLAHERLDAAAQRAMLTRDFGNDAWLTPRLLDEVARTDDLYFDEMRQVVMDTWSRGRITLVGDAAHCASPASGLGTTLALLDAYVLAGELSRTSDHTAAFARYEQRMRPVVAACQHRGRTGGNSYITKHRLWLQLQQIRLSNVPVLRSLTTRRTAGVKHAIANEIDLPHYRGAAA